MNNKISPTRCELCNGKLDFIIGHASRRVIDITGKIFCRLVVKHLVGVTNNKKYRDTYWCCACSCGNSTIVLKGNLRSGNTESCGCLNKDIVSSIKETHGLSRSRIYNSWCNMIARCCNEKSTEYHRYGTRGIVICDEWRNSFEIFYNDMGDRPAGMTLERIDNNIGYKPGNCRWATPKEQNNNRRSNHLLSVGEETHTLQQWSEIVGLYPSSIIRRINRGLSVEDALTLPKHINRGKYERRNKVNK